MSVESCQVPFGDTEFHNTLRSLREQTVWANEQAALVTKQNIELLQKISDLEASNAKNRDFIYAVRDLRRFQKGGMPLDEGATYDKNKAYVDAYVRDFTMAEYVKAQTA